jgi:hypothetical protein
MCLQPGDNSRSKGFYDVPSNILKEMVESIEYVIFLTHYSPQ